MRRGLRKLATGLVLAVYMLTGIAPAQAFVVCLEPGGAVALEVLDRGTLCPAGETEEPAPAVEGAHTGCCPCVDIPLPTQDEDPQAKPESSDGSAAGAAPAACFGTVAAAVIAPLSVLARQRPRPPPRLALIKTVVLRI